MADDNGEILKANLDIDASQIKPGMIVLGADREEIGSVKEVRTNDFLVDRKLKRDVYVPLHRVQRVGLLNQALVFEVQIQLDVDSHRVDDQHWERS